MAFYANDTKIVNGENIIKYHVDTEAEMKDLPTEQVGNSSSAFFYDTGRLAFKTDKGWSIPAWMK